MLYACFDGGQCCRVDSLPRPIALVGSLRDRLRSDRVTSLPLRRQILSLARKRSEIRIPLCRTRRHLRDRNRGLRALRPLGKFKRLRVAASLVFG